MVTSDNCTPPVQHEAVVHIHQHSSRTLALQPQPGLHRVLRVPDRRNDETKLRFTLRPLYTTYCTPVDDQPHDLPRPLVPEPAGVHQVALLGDDHVRGPGPALHHTPELPRTKYYY